jgi:hypothetical protein
LRWHRKEEQVRELLFLGLIVRDEIQKRSGVGRVLAQLREARLTINRLRRKGSSGMEFRINALPHPGLLPKEKENRSLSL